jgi:protein tyrosine phosphatase (PTP) superfamily phosphohydrolase (DUF442 family)
MAVTTSCATTPQPSPLAVCSRPLTPLIANSCAVDDKLWRGARPDADGIAALVQQGVKTVVNLELIANDKTQFETALVAPSVDNRIGYFRVRDWEPLAVLSSDILDDHVAHFLAITRSQPAPIFVHCRSGQNRTGVMVAAYRVFNGVDTEAVIKDMQGYGGIWFNFDAEYIRSLTPERKADIEHKAETWRNQLQAEATIHCTGGRCRVMHAGYSSSFWSRQTLGMLPTAISNYPYYVAPTSYYLGSKKTRLPLNHPRRHRRLAHTHHPRNWLAEPVYPAYVSILDH